MISNPYALHWSVFLLHIWLLLWYLCYEANKLNWKENFCVCKITFSRTHQANSRWIHRSLRCSPMWRFRIHRSVYRQVVGGGIQPTVAYFIILKTTHWCTMYLVTLFHQNADVPWWRLWLQLSTSPCWSHRPVVSTLHHLVHPSPPRSTRTSPAISHSKQKPSFPGHRFKRREQNTSAWVLIPFELVTCLP